MARPSTQLYPNFRAGIAIPWGYVTNRFSRHISQPSPSPKINTWISREVISSATVRDELLAKVEAALFTADEPLSPKQLAKLADLSDAGEARRQVHRLNVVYKLDGSAFYVEELAGGYQLLTRAELRPWLGAISRVHEDLQLSGPALETLAIVAYRQPINRADVEAIRGVQVGEILKQLMERGLVRFAGKEETLGRPFLYGTTKRFLEVFGLRNLHELPLVELLTKPKAPEAIGVSVPTTAEEVGEESDDGVEEES